MVRESLESAAINEKLQNSSSACHVTHLFGTHCNSVAKLEPLLDEIYDAEALSYLLQSNCSKIKHFLVSCLRLIIESLGEIFRSILNRKDPALCATSLKAIKAGLVLAEAVDPS